MRDRGGGGGGRTSGARRALPPCPAAVSRLLLLLLCLPIVRFFFCLGSLACLPSAIPLYPLRRATLAFACLGVLHLKLVVLQKVVFVGRIGKRS